MSKQLFSKRYPGHRTTVSVGPVLFGAQFVIIGGPCAVENEDQFSALLDGICGNIDIVRGMLFKPRTSPYSFAGLEEAGLSFLENVRARYGKPVLVEALDHEQVRKLNANADMLQIGARNMYNYPLLKAVAQTGKPVLLKRHFAATIDELLHASEYILAEGNNQVVLCERGIRSFDSRNRNCLDLAAVALLKQLTHLPVIVDPSHATGDSSIVRPLSLAAAAVGADGLLLEVHQDPVSALSDGPQAITPAELDQLTIELRAVLSSLPGRNKD